MPLQKDTIVVDANVILRYFLRDHEEFYREAEIFFKEVFKGKKTAYVLQSVVAEVVYVLMKVYKIPKNEISEVLIDFFLKRGIKVQDKEITIKALQLFKSEKLDFVDCLLCASARKFKIKTFDKGVKSCIEKHKES